MRKVLISLLLAGAAATPAIAAPFNWSNNHQQSQVDRQQEREQAREDRQSAREDRQSARQERVQVREDSRANVNANARADRTNFAGRYNGNGNAYVAPGAVAPGIDARERAQQNRDQRIQNRDQRVQDRDQRIQEREARQSARQSNVIRNGRPPVVSQTPRPGTQPPLRYDGNHSQVHWDTNWRNNSHYDWHRYRNHHHSLFHLGFYYDPFGWGYQPFSIGWRLWPAYYGNQYWIDPGMYQLPYPPPGAMWVRYWNDALLVDMYTGTVIDVIPGFFW